MNKRYSSGAVCIASIALALTAPAQPASAAPAETSIDVQHNVVYPPQFHDDDICGLRASTETFINRTQLTRLTALPNGSFHFGDFETGLVVTDYVDPAIPDTTRRRTETFEINLTPGETFVLTNTIRDTDGTLTIRAVYHLTEVDGVPTVERELTSVTGCP